jgi:hypothetical protein
MKLLMSGVVDYQTPIRLRSSEAGFVFPALLDVAEWSSSLVEHWSLHKSRGSDDAAPQIGNYHPAYIPLLRLNARATINSSSE